MAKAGAAMLGKRALNRALLERQLLLRRRALDPLAAVEHLVGLQAQAPLAPYVALWSRLSDFDPADLAAAIESRAAARGTLMRATIHLASARDFPALYALAAPAIRREAARGPQLGSAPARAVIAAGAEALARAPLTRAKLGHVLAERWPAEDPVALARAATFNQAVVHVPPRGLWSSTGPAALTTAEAWLGRRPAPQSDLAVMVKRYLGAFGPASPADFQTWSGLTGTRAVFDELRGELRVFRDEAGRELFDLPAAPRPDPETPAPPRFLPEYDNVLLSHAERSRILPAGAVPPLPPGAGARRGTVLSDGFMAGTWRADREDPARPVVEVRLGAALSRDARSELEDEGGRLLAFLAPEAEGTVAIEA